MSIILKGIDMPEKENQMYMMELYSDGHCSVAKMEDGECYELTIPSETEAIQIPKDHGRLIDADETRTQYYQTMDELLQSTTINISAEALSLLCGLTLINNAPTILETEE